MEQEGLRRIMNRMKERSINISAIVTDWHISIQKWLSESYMDTKDFLDVWHVAKGGTCALQSVM